MWLRIRCFVSCWRTTVEGASVRLIPIFRRRIWLCRRNMTRIRSFVRGGFLLGKIRLRSLGYFIRIPWSLCRIVNSNSSGVEMVKKSKVDKNIAKNWLHLFLPPFWIFYSSILKANSQMEISKRCENIPQKKPKSNSTARKVSQGGYNRLLREMSQQS